MLTKLRKPRTERRLGTDLLAIYYGWRAIWTRMCTTPGIYRSKRALGSAIWSLMFTKLRKSRTERTPGTELLAIYHGWRTIWTRMCTNTSYISIKTGAGERYARYLRRLAHYMELDVHRSSRISIKTATRVRFARYLRRLVHHMVPDSHQT